MKRCQNCQKELVLEEAVAWKTQCPHCGADLHTCFHCSHYAPSTIQECKKNILPRIKDKKHANQCAAFVFREFQCQAKVTDAEKARQTINDLFGGL